LALSAAAVIGAPAPSYAADDLLTIVPTAGPAAGGVTMNITISTTFAASPYVQFNKAANCPNTYATVTAGSVVAATPISFTAGASINVTVPALTVGSNWLVCTYVGNVANSSAISGHSAVPYVPFAVAPTTMTLSPQYGSPAGSNTVTLNSTTGFGLNTTVEFNVAPCPATYATASATVFPATVAAITPGTSISVTAPTALSLTGTYYVCAYTGSTATSQLLTATSAANRFGFYPTLTLSSTTGVDGGGNSITATASGVDFPSGAAALFQPSTANCPAIFPTTGSPITAVDEAVRVLSPTKVAITVPIGVTTAAGPSYHVCVYTGKTSSDKQVAGTATPYTVGSQATITSVSPSSGPAQGGTLITVTGANLLATGGAITATLGGLPLENITLVGISGTGFTAITPPHQAGGPFAIMVVTPGNGTTTKSGVFTYTNGINVTPNTGSNASTVNLDVTGIGFSSLTFSGTNGNSPNDASGHVYLVSGEYNPTALVSGFKANGQFRECVGVLVISDVELICTLYLSGSTRPTSFPTADVPLTDADMAKGSDLLTVTAPALTAAHVGAAVVGAGIPAGAVITSVTSATTAVLSAKATATVTAATLAAPRDESATISGTTVTAAGQFTATDVGSTITGPGIPAGTTITAQDGDTATLSQPAQSGSGTVNIAYPAVPAGTYTITVVSSGEVGASGPSYTQSVISSGSTFTVAPY
jgi:hypothetical protein